jgi:hypothetical protein
MRRNLRRPLFGVSVLAAAILCMGLAGTALAGASKISRVGVPSHAKVNKEFSITIRGHAAKRERLYLFLDFFKCAGGPAGERSHHAPSVSGPVHGRFNLISKHWKSGRAGRIHACTYLVGQGSGVIAHRFASFQVR